MKNDDDDELNATVTMKHTGETGTVLWEKEYRVPNPSDAGARLTSDGDRILVTWPEGVAVFYLRPGERIEITGTEGDA